MNIKSLFYSLFLFSFGTAINLVPHPKLEASTCFQPNWCQIGNRGFSTMNPADWYEITTFPYPVPTLLSINPTQGSTQGMVELTSTGIQVGQPGNYFVTIQAILTNNDPDPNYTPLIPIFLIRNGVFDPTDTSNIGTVGSLPSGDIRVLTASGVLENVEAGTTLSIVATNGGSPEPEPITVVAWGISAFKIPCDPIPQ